MGASNSVSYHGELDDSAYDIIINSVSLNLTDDQFELHWNQKWTEDLQHLTTYEQVIFKGKVISIVADSPLGGVTPAGVRMLRVENQPQSVFTFPLLLRAINFFSGAAPTITALETGACPDFILEGDEGSPRLTLKMQHVTANNSANEMRVEEGVTNYEIARSGYRTC